MPVFLHGLPSRVSDPDQYWIRIQSGQWILIKEVKNDPQKVEKNKKFHVFKSWMFSIES